MNPDNIVSDAEAVAERWHADGYNWLVAHGLEDYPSRLGRDLDILMDPRDARSALSSAREVLETRGWDTFVCPPTLWGIRLVALRWVAPNTCSYLELHTMRQISWAFLKVADSTTEAVDSAGPFPTSRWVALVKGVVVPLLAGDTRRFDAEYVRRHAVDPQRRDELLGPLSRHFGMDLSRRLLTAIDNGEPRAVTDLAPALRRAAVWSMVRAPVGTLRNLVQLVRTRVGRLTKRTGVRVSLAIPVPSSDYVNEVAAELRRVFVIVKVERVGSLVDRVRRQYSSLCEQSAILEVASADAQEGIRIGIARGLRRSMWSDRIAAGSPPEVVASWIIRQWASRHACFNPPPAERDTLEQ